MTVSFHNVILRPTEMLRIGRMAGLGKPHRSTISIGENLV